MEKYKNCGSDSKRNDEETNERRNAEHAEMDYSKVEKMSFPAWFQALIAQMEEIHVDSEIVQQNMMLRQYCADFERMAISDR